MSNISFAAVKENNKIKDETLVKEDIVVTFDEVIEMNNTFETNEKFLTEKILNEDKINLLNKEKSSKKDEGAIISIEAIEDLGRDEIKLETNELLVDALLPDLIAYNVVSTSVQPLQVEDQIVFQFTVANTGLSDTGLFDVTMRIDGQYIGRFSNLSNLTSMTGRIYNVTLSANIINDGYHEVSFTADELEVITERYETNNKGFSMFTWTGGTPNLEGISLSTTGPYLTNTEIGFVYTIKNSGTADIGEFEMGIFVNDVLGGTKTYSSLASLTTANASFSLNVSGEGVYEVRAELDPNSNIAELSENDNSQTVTINVLPNYYTTWFSQKSASASGWDDSKLIYLFVLDGALPAINPSSQAAEWNSPMVASNNPAYVNPNEMPDMDQGHINRWGCVAASLSILLDTVGAVTSNTYYDFRDEQTKHLKPDPWTVTYGNIGYMNIDTVIETQDETVYNLSDLNAENYPNTYSSPVYMGAPYRGSGAVSSDYGYSTVDIQVSGLTVEQKIVEIDKYLALHPEGIMIRMDKYVAGNVYGHNLIITGHNDSYVEPLSTMTDTERSLQYDVPVPSLLTLERENYYNDGNNIIEMIKQNNDINNELGLVDAVSLNNIDDKYLVCDPSASVASQGDHVKYTDSISYNYVYKTMIEDMTYIRFINKN